MSVTGEILFKVLKLRQTDSLNSNITASKSDGQHKANYTNTNKLDTERSVVISFIYAGQRKAEYRHKGSEPLFLLVLHENTCKTNRRILSDEFNKNISLRFL